LVGLAGGAVSFFAQKLGIKLIANQGKIDIQAQNDAMTLGAMKDLTITSSAGSVTMAAKKSIVLACGGGYLKIHPSGEVEIGSPVKLTIKAPMASEEAVSLDVLSEMVPKVHRIQHQFLDANDQPYVGRKYEIRDAEDKVLLTGKTDAEGKTGFVDNLSTENYFSNLIKD
jgi:type VI secretion system secreted protein VgrG